MQVILLGVDSPIGLSVIRELAGHGVDVHGLAWSRAGIGLYSRHLKRGLIRARDEDALISQLNALAGETGCRWLMTVSENDILMLHRRRADLQHLTPLIPPPAPFHRVLDKAETFAAARKLGIRTPNTWQITHSSDIKALAADLQLPVVLKWANPQAVRAPLASIGQTLDKYRYLHDLDELQRYLAPLDAISQYPLIQEYCPGQGLGQMLYLHQGKPLLRFQHLRLREYPPEGGVSAVCAATTIDEQRMAGSIALLNALEWEGPAMVEYRYDPQSNSVCLMEI
ncbi:MAG: carboxylate--amine ligase, partial [Gammaproteobacteria bacterium]|nr:carboxylate--amine ligase [Gammaproteobacteria bacterium]